MSQIYSTAFSPDPGSARDVLAFVLCPARAFVPGGDAVEMEAVCEVIGPIKAEAIRRWQDTHAAATRS